MAERLPRFMLAAPRSGEGKTTAALALLWALKSMGRSPVCFKSGPDYIDPMFHRRALGIPGGNLDLFLSDEGYVRGALASSAKTAGVAVIEGAMGFYDGVGTSERAGCFHLARVTQTPVVLTLSARGAALSLAAVIKGMAGFRPGANISGVILNRCPEGLFWRLAPVLEKEAGIPVLGFLPDMPEASIESRHLGLVAADEIAGIKEKISALGAAAVRSIDLKRLLEIAASAPPVEAAGELLPPPPRLTVAVARDEAFCFYYEETLSLLRRLGADVAEFSPLRDGGLPQNAAALYLGGGYPELHAEALSENKAMLRAVRAAVEGGMPCIAECGGFLYLHERLFDAGGAPYPMAGVIKGEAKRGGLSRFGYVTLSPKAGSMLCAAGETLAAHEFHYWQSDNGGAGFRAEKEDGRGWDCVHAGGSLYAGFPHLYLAGSIKAAKRFIAAAEKYGEEHGLK